MSKRLVVDWEHFQEDCFALEAETERMIREEGFSQAAFGITRPLRMREETDQEYASRRLREVPMEYMANVAMEHIKNAE